MTYVLIFFVVGIFVLAPLVVPDLLLRRWSPNASQSARRRYRLARLGVTTCVLAVEVAGLAWYFRHAPIVMRWKVITPQPARVQILSAGCQSDLGNVAPDEAVHWTACRPGEETLIVRINDQPPVACHYILAFPFKLDAVDIILEK